MAGILERMPATVSFARGEKKLPPAKIRGGTEKALWYTSHYRCECGGFATVSMGVVTTVHRVPCLLMTKTT